MKHSEWKRLVREELKETIILIQSKGFQSGSENEVCLLRKSLSMDSSSPAEFGMPKSSTFLNSSDTHLPSNADPCLFMMNWNKKKSFILLYVDEILTVTDTAVEYENENLGYLNAQEMEKETISRIEELA